VTNLDAIYTSFITALKNDATVAALVPGGWRQGRHEQASPALGAYGIVRFDPVSTTPYAGGYYRLYTLTIQVYAAASSTAQAAIQAALAALFDFKPGAVSNPTGSAVNMIVPTTINQQVDTKMRNGTDMVPITQSWTVKMIESRA
jgi:hypothetical protein